MMMWSFHDDENPWRPFRQFHQSPDNDSDSTIDTEDNRVSTKDLFHRADEKEIHFDRDATDSLAAARFFHQQIRNARKMADDEMIDTDPKICDVKDDSCYPDDSNCAKTDQSMNDMSTRNKRNRNISNICRSKMESRNQRHFHNDNGNAYDRLISDLAVETECDDDHVQAEAQDKLSDIGDHYHPSTLTKIRSSRSLGTVSRKLVVKPRQCRSLEVCTMPSKASTDFDHFIEALYEAHKHERTVDALRAEWEEFHVNRRKNVTNNDEAQVTRGPDDCSVGREMNEDESVHFPFWKENLQDFADNSSEVVEENQWSPFMSHSRSQSRLFNEYRQRHDDSSSIDGRSSVLSSNEGSDFDPANVEFDFSDDGNDGYVGNYTEYENDDATSDFDHEKQNYHDETEYEIIEWNEYTTGYIELENGKGMRTDLYDAKRSSPTLDLKSLEGYHTAPSSPQESGEGRNLNTEAISLRPCRPKCVRENKYAWSSNRHSKWCNTEHTAIALRNRSHQDDDIKCQADIRNCGETWAQERSKADKTFVSKPDQVYKSRIANMKTENGRIEEAKTRAITLEDPPFISVDSIHYEANPATGTCKVVGCGSFGKVYKARFSDPAFFHLPIVVKEFNDYFTDPQEIMDEAKRLLYLQDTGYVPVCYGVLCFGSLGNQKFGIVQEYVGTGFTLEQLLWEQNEFPVDYWFRVAIQSCEGLARFHEKGILLNDLKTNNILLEFGNHTIRIRYIDFGLATDMRGKRYKNTRSLEEFVYLAPEVRLRGQATTFATDIYSLGFMLEQLYRHARIHDFAVVAKLCMDIDPDMRLPIRGALSLLRERFARHGYDPLLCDID